MFFGVKKYLVKISYFYLKIIEENFCLTSKIIKMRPLEITLLTPNLITDFHLSRTKPRRSQLPENDFTNGSYR